MPLFSNSCKLSGQASKHRQVLYHSITYMVESPNNQLKLNWNFLSPVFTVYPTVNIQFFWNTWSDSLTAVTSNFMVPKSVFVTFSSLKSNTLHFQIEEGGLFWFLFCRSFSQWLADYKAGQ